MKKRKAGKARMCGKKKEKGRGRKKEEEGGNKKNT